MPTVEGGFLRRQGRSYKQGVGCGDEGTAPLPLTWARSGAVRASPAPYGLFLWLADRSDGVGTCLPANGWLFAAKAAPTRSGQVTTSQACRSGLAREKANSSKDQGIGVRYANKGEWHTIIRLI